MIRVRARLALIAVSITTTAIPLVSIASPVSAVGTTRYVAATGSVGAGTSCSSPGYVGATHASIQAAMNAASSGDVVHVCAGTYSISTRLEITKTLTLRGAGASSTILDGGGATQILIVQDASIDDNVNGDEITATVESLSFINGYAQDVNGTECGDGNRCGGAIFVENESRINISSVHFKNNKADFIGGAFARFLSASEYPTVASSINDSSFESNKALLDGGAIATLFGFGLTVNRSTFFQNGLLPTHMARSGAAVIANFASAVINDSTIVDHDAPADITVLYGDLTLNRSLVAQTSVSTTNICNGQQTLSGTRGNLVTDGTCGVTQSKAAAGAGNSARVTYADLKLGTFAYRGYATKSIPLLAGSAALDHASGCTTTDQVGLTAPQGSGCDVGAVERSASQTVNTVDTAPWSYGGATLYRSSGSTVALVAGATDAAGQGVTYSSKTSGVCTVNSSTGATTLVSDGTCTLTASAPGYLLRDEASADKSWQVAATAPSTTTSTTTTTVAQSTTTTIAAAPTSTSTTVASGAVAPVSATTTTTTIVSDPAGSDESAATAENRRTVTAAPPDAATASSTTIPATTTTVSGVRAPDAPGAEPGSASASVDGESIDATLERLDNSYVVSGAGVNVTVSGLGADGSRIPLDPDGTLRLESGDSVVVDAAGYAAGSDIEAWMFSTPVKLGALKTDESGGASMVFPVPLSLESGNHRLVLRGPNSNGSDVVLSMGLALGAYESGTSVRVWVIALPIAAAVIVAVVIPTTLRRRRKIRVSA
ncbi:MAG: choice-of-anchor Q domain-containing protein [Actinomycetota bacterium]